MDINLEKYTEELLKGYCEKKPSTKSKYTKSINIIKKYSTNVLESHDPDSIKECKIRDSDPLINMTNPIAKTREDYENVLGNIIEAECKLIDNTASSQLTPELLKLINFCNKRILEFNKNPIKSVENCNFKIKVLNKEKEILFDQSTLYSVYQTLYDFLRNMVPIRICTTIADLQILYDDIIHVVSLSDASYIECKLSEYMFQTNEGNRICLTNNRDEIINTSKFILDLYDEFCTEDSTKPYLEDLKKYIDNILNNNKYNSFEQLDSNNYYYLSNSGDGDCLFIAVAKYLCISSNTERQYPNIKILKDIAKELRLETCKYMFHNRYKVVNDSGTIENNTEASVWLLHSQRGETNNDKFNSLIDSLSIQRNIALFKNPTYYTLEELINLHQSGDIDEFTKYCILMAQHSMASEYFLLSDSTKLYLSCYAGICEILCLSLFLNKNIICSSTTLKEGSDADFKYNVGTKFSYMDKFNTVDIIELPILIYLRGYKTKRGGSKSDHFEIIWPKSLGKPTGVNAPKKLVKTQEPLFGFDTTHTEKFIPNYDTTTEVSIERELYDIDNFINSNIPAIYVEEFHPIIVKYWSDVSKKLSTDADTLEHPNFGDLDKEIFVEDDTIRINEYLYSLNYITRFTEIMGKGFATRGELEELIEKITETKKLDLNKPIEVKVSEPDDEGNINAIYINFRDEQTLLSLLKSKDIIKYIKTIKPDIPTGVEESEQLDETSKTPVDLDPDWVIFGNYHYKKSYIQLPLQNPSVTDKDIIKALKKLQFHKQSNPIKVIENFEGESYENDYIFGLYDEDLLLQNM